MNMTGIYLLELVLKYGPGVIKQVAELRAIGDRELTEADWDKLLANHRTYDEIMSGR